MAGTRRVAREHLQSILGRVPRYFYSSKLFPTEESAIRRPAWWYILPLGQIREARSETVYLVGLDARGEVATVLAVPHQFLLDHLGELNVSADNEVWLHPAADGPDRLTDYRNRTPHNPGLDFSDFELR